MEDENGVAPNEVNHFDRYRFHRFSPTVDRLNRKHGNPLVNGTSIHTFDFIDFRPHLTDRNRKNRNLLAGGRAMHRKATSIRLPLSIDFIDLRPLVTVMNTGNMEGFQQTNFIDRTVTINRFY